MYLPATAQPLTAFWVILCLGLTAPTHALEAEQDLPFEGTISHEQVTVYAGAGRTFYPVGELNAGDPVTVDDVIYGWFKITPPTGIYSYISKNDVKPNANRSTAKVIVNRARVMAAGVAGPEESYRRQVDLLKGAQVKIHGEDGPHYTISPPPGAYVYLPPAAVIRAGQENTHEHTTRQITTSVPKLGTPAPEHSWTSNESQADTATSPNPLDIPDTDLTLPITQTIEDPIGPPTPGEVLDQLERKLRESDIRTTSPTAITELRSAYERLSNTPQLTNPQRRLVTDRLNQLRDAEALAQTIDRLNRTRQDVQFTGNRSTWLPKPPPEKNILEGRLLASSLYNGINLPKRFRLVDPTTGRTLAYLQPGTELHPGRFLGQNVRVKLDGPTAHRTDNTPITRITNITAAAH